MPAHPRRGDSIALQSNPEEAAPPTLAPCRSGHAAHSESGDWQTLAIFSGLCLLFGLAGLTAIQAGAPAFIASVLFALSYLFGGWDSARECAHQLRRGHLEIHFLMLFVALGAALIGAWSEGALLLFLFSASGAMEHFASARTQREIGVLLRGAPKFAIRVDSGREAEVAVEQLAAGMTVRVRSGDLVPADVRVVHGESACDESNLTGEARPVTKEVGDVALAGTVNLWGVIDGEVLRPASESALQKIIRLIEQAQEMKAPSQRFSDRFGSRYTWFVLVACTAFFLFGWLVARWPPLFGEEGQTSAFYRAMALLVVLSPCALVLSVPSAILSAIAAGARRGVLFRGGAAVERLADLRVVALDKTGTLTSGEPAFIATDVYSGDEEQMLEVAYNLARLSNHPLSRAVQKLGMQRALPQVEFGNVKANAGGGLRGDRNGNAYLLGSRRYVHADGTDDVCAHAEPTASDIAEVWVGGQNLCGRLLFRDEVRPAARGLLERLHEERVRTVMLTGDRMESATSIAQEVALDEVCADLSPDAKVEAVQRLKSCGTVAMIGDGVNDAPCLAAADVGVAMGARASDAALEQADVVLMNDRLENFLTAFELSRRARRIIRENIAISLGTVIFMGLLAVTRGIPLALGVFAHEGSTVLVVLNSLRLLLRR
ncbi:MAG: heavy metal translocating P-type ATPase [Chthoniobacterales bacterium]